MARAVIMPILTRAFCRSSSFAPTSIGRAPSLPLKSDEFGEPLVETVMAEPASLGAPPASATSSLVATAWCFALMPSMASNCGEGVLRVLRVLRALRGWARWL